MNNTFDFNRFSKVLVNDLRKAWQNYGPSFLILVLMPVIYLLMYGILPMIFGAGWQIAEKYSRLGVMVLCGAVFIITFPQSVYGKITEKRYGSDYLMLPASTLEKYVAMILNCGLIAPLAFLVGYLSVDALVAGLGIVSGGSLFSLINSSVVMHNDTFISVDIWQLSIIYLSVYLLVFLLGAIYFKKHKVVMTILSLFALSVVFSAIASPIMMHAVNNGKFLGITPDGFVTWMENHANHIGFYINFVIDFFLMVDYLIVGGLIYLRMKTLKH